MKCDCSIKVYPVPNLRLTFGRFVSAVGDFLQCTSVTLA